MQAQTVAVEQATETTIDVGASPQRPMDSSSRKRMIDEIISPTNTTEINASERRRKETKRELMKDSQEYDEAMVGLTKLVGALDKLCSKHVNTQCEIKLTVKKLVNATQYLATTEGLRKKAELERREKLKDRLETNRDEHRPSRIDQATQTATAEQLETEWITDKLRNVTSLDEFVSLAREEWPTAAYSATSIHNIAITADAEMRLALVCEKNTNDVKIFNKLVQQFPVTAELGSLDVGTTATLLSGGLLRLEGTDEQKPNPKILVVGKFSKEQQPPEILSLMERMVRSVKDAERSGLTGPIKEIAVHVSSDADEDTLRKLHEHMFFETGTRVKICRPKGLGSKTTGRHNANATIMLSSEECSYADMLKKIKSTVDPNNVGA